jgi:hypothetical protein
MKSLFLTAYIQVLLVAVNTWQISHQKYVGAVIVGFLISLVWSFNVKRVAFATWNERIVYSVGAGLGTISGLFASHLIYQ